MRPKLFGDSVAYGVSPGKAARVPISSSMESEDTTAQGGRARLLTPCDGCIEVIFEGVVDGPVVKQAVDRLRQMASRRPPQYLLVDGTSITNYDGSVRDEGRELLQVVRDGGGKEVVMVLSSAVHRLLGATVAMMVRIPIKIFATRAEALGYVERKIVEF
jgi:hypothetical protein